MLIVPQIVLWTFAFVWLHIERGWSIGTTSGVIAIAYGLSALSRVLAGWWSDRIGSRMWPRRALSIAVTAAMTALAVTDGLSWFIAVPIMMAATVISAATIGLVFTAVGEIAGPHWSGRSLGIQNTCQYLVSAAVPPALGAVITSVGYPVAFAAAALLGAAAVIVTPGEMQSAQ